MGSTDVALLGVLVFLSLGLSFFAIRVNMMLWRLGAALSWFAIGDYSSFPAPDKDRYST